jgi:hypothetical protein
MPPITPRTHAAARRAEERSEIRRKAIDIFGNDTVPRVPIHVG